MQIVNHASSQPKETEQCNLAIGIHSKAQDHVKRDVVRQTWAKDISKSDSILILFVIGSTDSEPPHEKVQLERENTVGKDLLFLNISGLDEEHNFLKSLDWFSWAARNTNCRLIFNTRDDSYVRIKLMLYKLNSLFGPEPKKKYFGILSNDNSTTYMSKAGYGVSHDVALWMSQNRDAYSGLISSEDIAIGNMLAILSNTSGLDYFADSSSFGTNCTEETVLDSPDFSHGFNMYVRYYDEIDGNFCSHVDRSTAGSEIQHKRGTEGFFSFEPVTLSRLSLLDDSVAPWNRSNRWRHTEDRDWSHSRTPYTFFPWKALRKAGVYGGDQVFQRHTPSEQSLYDIAVRRAKSVASRHFAPCRAREMATWLKSWGRQREYMVHISCRAKSILVHVPFRPDGHLEVFSPAYIAGDNRLVVIVPISCRLDTLESFLNTTGRNFNDVRRRQKRIILAWSHCSDRDQNFSESEIRAVAEGFQSASTTEVQLIYFEDGASFSRSRALNMAFRACEPDDIAVVMDVDVLARVEFFLNCLVFTRPGHSLYFPIMFSRYNPESIARFASARHGLVGSIEWLSKPDTVTPETGMWRESSLGMVAVCVRDAARIGLFDDAIQGWGLEDVQFFERAYAAGYVNWRMYEPSEVHIYHPKDCGGLAPGSERYHMCLTAMLRLEGSQLQVALMLHEKRQELARQSAGGGQRAGGQPAGDGRQELENLKETGDSERPAGDSDAGDSAEVKPAGDSEKPTGDSEEPTGVSEKPTGVSEKPAGDWEKPAGEERPVSVADSELEQRGARTATQVAAKVGPTPKGGEKATAPAGRYSRGVSVPAGRGPLESGRDRGPERRGGPPLSSATRRPRPEARP